MRLQQALCLLAVIVLISQCDGLKAQADEKVIPTGDFEGKYLRVQEREGAAAYLEKVQLKKLANSYFLVGIGIDLEVKYTEWQKGLEVWVPVNEILEITVFPNKADLVKAVKERAKEKVEKK